MSNNKTQSGKVKVNGDKTIQQKFNIKGKQLTDVKIAMKEHQKSDFGLHVLLRKSQKHLRRPCLSHTHTTAARMMKNFATAES
jgi:hypothetical protein